MNGWGSVIIFFRDYCTLRDEKILEAMITLSNCAPLHSNCWKLEAFMGGLRNVVISLNFFNIFLGAIYVCSKRLLKLSSLTLFCI